MIKVSKEISQYMSDMSGKRKTIGGFRANPELAKKLAQERGAAMTPEDKAAFVERMKQAKQKKKDGLE